MSSLALFPGPTQSWVVGGGGGGGAEKRERVCGNHCKRMGTNLTDKIKHGALVFQMSSLSFSSTFHQGMLNLLHLNLLDTIASQKCFSALL